MAATFGEDRRVEPLPGADKNSTRRSSVQRLAKQSPGIRENPPRGEFVVVVEGAQEVPSEELSIEAGAKLVRAEIEKGLSKKDAVKLVAKQTGLPRNALYEAALQDED